jgi:hydroxyacylglutathione hydrolase
MSVEIVPVPALSDNYVWLVRDAASGAVAVVDPAAADPVAAALDARGWRPTLILNTHHHGDHVGGNAELKARYGCPVVGPAADAHRIPGMDRGVREGEAVPFGGAAFRTLETPGHTTGHVSFHLPEASAVFCGDTLFSLGCGRMFEGTPEGFWTSLSKLRALPDDTLVCCGHEYTASNARFAVRLDPANPALAARAAEVERLRAEGRPTVPSRLGGEKAANPFLRADDPSIAAAVGLPGGDPAAVFAAVRRAKDNS